MASISSSLGNEARGNIPMRLSGFVIGAFMPITLYFSTKSVTLFVGFAAILALAGLFQTGRAMQAVSFLRGPHGAVFWAGLAFLAYISLSAVWSDFPGTVIGSVGEFLLALGVSAAVGIAYRILLPYRFGFGIAIGLIVAAVVALIEFRAGMWLRGALGNTTFSYVFNRSVVYQVMLIWPMILLIETRYQWLGLCALAMVGLMATVSDSGAAVMSLIVGGACAGFASIASRAMPWLLATGTVIYLAIAPWLGRYLDSTLREELQRKLGGAHAVERIDIWRAYGEFLQGNFYFGIGFGGSAIAPQHPASQLVTESLRTWLEKRHPHNAFLQVWVELGLVGAVIVGFLAVFALMSINRLEWRERVIATGFAGATLAITAVSHGAWQAWWVTTASLCAAMFWATKETTAHVPHRS